MSEMSPLTTGPVNRAGRVGPASSGRGSEAESARIPGRDRGEDRVEFSSHVQYLIELKNGGPVRTELVNRIRSEIEQGTYETPEKLEAAIDELLGDLADD